MDYRSLGHDNRGNFFNASTTSSSSSQTSTITITTTTTNFNFATINCRGLWKSGDPSARKHFIRYLRTQSLDILALQEMHASSVELQQVFYIQFQAKDSIWSRHCGLVCFSPDLLFTNTTISDCGRIITAIISHKHQTFDPLTVSVLYAPANRRRRYIFLSDILRHPSDVLSISPVRQILLGNFNYSYATHLSISRPRQAPSSWLQYINQFFHDGITAVGNPSEATFHRGMTRSCNDYIFFTHGSLDCK